MTRCAVGAVVVAVLLLLSLPLYVLHFIHVGDATAGLEGAPTVEVVWGLTTPGYTQGELINRSGRVLGQFRMFLENGATETQEHNGFYTGTVQHDLPAQFTPDTVRGMGETTVDLGERNYFGFLAGISSVPAPNLRAIYGPNGEAVRLIQRLSPAQLY